MSSYECVALHRSPQHKHGCAEVLMEQWPRSIRARLSMLDKSNDGLPYSLVMLERTGDVDDAKVIGHARLSRVVVEDTAGFIESVVIRRDRRGAGLGRKLMEETEKHARRLGLTKLYLSTHDKQDFYAHLGFTFCQPVMSCSIPAKLLSSEQIKKLFGVAGSMAGDFPLSTPVDCIADGDDPRQAKCCQPRQCCASPPPPPPCSLPPPPPPSAVSRIACDWMVKTID